MKIFLLTFIIITMLGNLYYVYHNYISGNYNMMTLSLIAIIFLIPSLYQTIKLKK